MLRSLAPDPGLRVALPALSERTPRGPQRQGLQHSTHAQWLPAPDQAGPAEPGWRHGQGWAACGPSVGSTWRCGEQSQGQGAFSLGLQGLLAPNLMASQVLLGPWAQPVPWQSLRTWPCPEPGHAPRPLGSPPAHTCSPLPTPTTYSRDHHQKEPARSRARPASWLTTSQVFAQARGPPACSASPAPSPPHPTSFLCPHGQGTQSSSGTLS